MSIWLPVESRRIRSGASIMMLAMTLAACAGPKLGAGCLPTGVDAKAPADQSTEAAPDAVCTRSLLAPPVALLTPASGSAATSVSSDTLPVTLVEAAGPVAAVPLLPLKPASKVDPKAPIDLVAIARTRLNSDGPIVTGSILSPSKSTRATASAASVMPPPLPASSTESARASQPLPPPIDTTRDADITGSLGKPLPRDRKEPSGKVITMADAVAQSVASHPEVAVSRAAADEARAGVTVARAGYMPQVDATVSSGYGTPESPDSDFNPFLDGPEAQAKAQMSLRQLVYDFGATRDDIERSRSILAAQNFKIMDKVEEIARKMSDAYLKILEQRQLLRAADENLYETRKLADLVRANQKDGNGTVADVSHIDSRLVEAQTVRTNLQADLGAAEDQFRRLAKMPPANLKSPPSFSKAIPPTVDQALDVAESHHPRLLAWRAQTDAMNADLDSKRKGKFPKVTFEASASAKNQLGTSNTPSYDLKGMLVLRYKMFDGGATRAVEEQVSAKLVQNDMRMVADRDEIEADLREFYRAIRSARTKYASLREGLAASRQAKEMYVEQFKAGKRTMFELLDRQNGVFQAQRDVISNQFAETRANIGILRSIGLLTTTVIAR